MLGVDYVLWWVIGDEC